ncbi:MAG: mannitol-1-phosphate 5-dehydrogenase [Candidatus Latescibacterota bacterium]
MSGKIVVFGAGATGRAHVGLLAWQAGYGIVFVDKKQELIEILNNAGRYRVKLYGNKIEEITVSGYTVYSSEERESIADEIADSDLVLTTVFDQNLSDVAKTIALSIRKMRLKGRTNPLNYIACENMMDSSTCLKKYVFELLDSEDIEYLEKYLGFPDCMISRVVPVPENPLKIIAEDYNEWTARADSFKGDKPKNLAALELVKNQTARLERKLFIHNGGHAVCGYFGFHRGWKYIHEAVGDPVVAEHVLGALDELGEIVKKKHGFSAESIELYKKDLVRRGSVPEMKDEILRVVRDPARKLSPKERLVAPAVFAFENSLPRKWIIAGIIAALKYYQPRDIQSAELQDKINKFGLDKVLETVCSLDHYPELMKEIIEAWKRWNIQRFTHEKS